MSTPAQRSSAGRLDRLADYDVGAFFYLNTLARPIAFFLAQWPQSDQPVPAQPNAYLHYNIMALESLR